MCETCGGTREVRNTMPDDPDVPDWFSRCPACADA